MSYSAATYHSAPFTLALRAPIPDEGPQAASTTPAQAAEINAAQEEFVAPLAGNLGLTSEVTAPLVLQATVEVAASSQVDPANRRVVVAWGDSSPYTDLTLGGPDPTQYVTTHAYALAGSYNIAAVLIDAGGTESAVAKTRVVSDTPDAPQ